MFSFLVTLSTWSGRNNAETQSYLQQDLLVYNFHALLELCIDSSSTTKHAVRMQQYNLKRPWTPPTHAEYYDHHRMALTARTRKIRTKAREFRGRARARIAARPPTRYNSYYDYNY